MGRMHQLVGQNLGTARGYAYRCVRVDDVADGGSRAVGFGERSTGRGPSTDTDRGGTRRTYHQIGKRPQANGQRLIRVGTFEAHRPQ